MKNILIFSTVILFVFFSGCKKDSPTEPQPTKPPGYQEDIPWPSLADSPWPMNHHDPQSTGRSKFSSNINGILFSSIDSISLQASVIANSDSSIIFISLLQHYGVYSLNSFGLLDLVIKNGVQILEEYSTPLLGRDATIYFTSGYGGKLYAVYNGEIKWEYAANAFVTQLGINIDIDGNIFFMSRDNNPGAKLNVVDKNGNLKWELYNPDFLNHGGIVLTFSPDGKTLYTPGLLKTIHAIDISTQRIIWSFGEGASSAASIVDSYGNIYVLNGQGSLFCLDSDGSVKWEYVHGIKAQLHSYSEGCIDKYGNIYFAFDSLYSVDYKGKLRWKVDFVGSTYTPLVCDGNSNIYVVSNHDSETGLMIVSAFNSEGIKLWENVIPGFNLAGASPAIAFNSLYVPTFQHGGIYVFK